MENQVKLPSKSVLTMLVDNYKNLEKLQKELLTNAKALWASLPYDERISCCDEGLEFNDSENEGLITAFVNDSIDKACYAIVADNNTENEFYVSVYELPTETYLYLANFIAEKYLEKY